MIFVCWFVATLSQIPSCIQLSLNTTGPFFRCSSLMLKEEWVGVTFVTIQSSILVVIPCTLMLYIYIRMGMMLSEDSIASSSDSKNMNSSRSNSMKKANANILQMCIILFALYILTYGYHYVLFVWYIFSDMTDFNSVNWFFGLYILCLNSVVNPFIYALRQV